MKINILTLPSNQYFGIGEGHLGNFAQWPVGEELREKHFDKNATKEFRDELKKRVRKTQKLVGSQ
jgi:hypothetical protein